MNALYQTQLVHVRTEPVRHEVRHRGYQWLVDLDELPRLPRLVRGLARFEARDHAGDPARSLRANVDTYLADNGIDLRGGRVRMLANARSMGYVFNPLSLFWCHDQAGALACVIAEVHNTYGQRHRYLLRPDDAGRADVTKQFYVSPFNRVDGHYRMSVPEPGDRLAVTITLHRAGMKPFTASVRGVRTPATTRAVLATAVRQPFATWRVRALITWHGIALWRKGLAVQPRPNPDVAQMPRRPAQASVAQRLATLLRAAVGVELPVRLRAWDGSEAGPGDGPVLIIRSRRTLRRLLWAPPELGLARAYVAGELDIDGDLTDGLRRAWALAGSRPARVGIGAKLTAVGLAARLGALGPAPLPPSTEARLTGRRHTPRRDRAAIAHHYDLSNDFYQLLLDESMAYSCAYYSHPGQTLADAQRAKLDVICRKLELERGRRLLDVGCGWGSLIVHAAERFGAQATGITLSAQQRDHIEKRIAERGLQDRVSVRLADYRELAGTGEKFDAVASIEMGEHVGEGRYPEYLARLLGALQPSGRLLLQQMSRRHDAAPGGGPFIESYIAPDMHMRPLARTIEHLASAGFEVLDVEGLRKHYVRTVRAWLETLQSHHDEFVALVGEEIVRIWRLYLAGGALSFEQGRMGVDQILAHRSIG